MAITIPAHFFETADQKDATQRFGIALCAALTKEDCIWFNGRTSWTRPTFVILSQSHGVVGVDVYDWSCVDIETADAGGITVAGQGRVDPVGQLGRRLEELRRSLRGISAAVPVGGLLGLPHLTRSAIQAEGLAAYFDGLSVVTADDVTPESLRRCLPVPRTSIGQAVLAQVRSALYPETEFHKTALMRDEDRVKRRTLRIRLDQQQESIAADMDEEFVLVTGPAGSGKTLVLCARARMLAREHPDWVIQFLCFNRSLVPYLESLLGEARQRVCVSTFHKWASSHGIWMPLAQSNSRTSVEEAVERAMRRKRHVATLDACLVDEGQDFHPGWLTLVRQAVRSGRGGIAIASDSAQSIYCNPESDHKSSFKGFKHLTLNHSYRCTKQIGHFAICTAFDHLSESTTQTPAFTTEGPRVQMVWADRWDGQAAFIAHEIKRIVAAGQAAYRDIAVLYTKRRSMVRRLIEALDAADLPFYWVNRDAESKSSLDLTTNTVKLMTVHSAKGLEFPIVFVFGVEALKVGLGAQNDADDGLRNARLAYVGMTRAQDILYLTHTRTNIVLERAQRASRSCEFHTWPDDFQE